MCNEAYRRIQIGQLREGWSQLKIPLRFPDGIPNRAPLDGIRITDRIEIVRAAADAPGERRDAVASANSVRATLAHSSLRRVPDQVRDDRRARLPCPRN